jgi:ATP10 protein
MKNITLQITCFFIFLALNSVAQKNTSTDSVNRETIVGKAFSTVKAKTLLNNNIVFPAVVKGKTCIVSVAFNDDSRPMTDEWVKIIPAKYVDSTIVFYEIPMIKNAPKLFRGAIEKGMRKGIDVKLHNNVANYYGKIDTYKMELLMPNESSCYVFVLDKDGKIKTSVEGVPTAENLKKIAAALK